MALCFIPSQQRVRLCSSHSQHLTLIFTQRTATEPPGSFRDSMLLQKSHRSIHWNASSYAFPPHFPRSPSYTQSTQPCHQLSRVCFGQTHSSHRFFNVQQEKRLEHPTHGKLWHRGECCIERWVAALGTESHHHAPQNSPCAPGAQCSEQHVLPRPKILHQQRKRRTVVPNYQEDNYFL